MRREFLINVFFLLLINLLIKPLYIFGIERTVQNQVGEEAYGIYFSLLSFSILFYIIHEPGIHTFNSGWIARSPNLFSRYFPVLFWLKILLSILFIVITFFCAWIIGYEIKYYKLLLFICINQILHTTIFFLRSNVAALGFYRWDSILSSLDRFLLLLIMGGVLFSNFLPTFLGIPFSIEIFIYAQTLTLFCTSLACFSIIFWKTKLPISTLFRVRLKGLFLWAILKRVAPYALAVFLMAIYGRIDAVLLERWLPDGKLQAGIYAAAYRLLDAANMMGVLLASLLVPMFSKLWAAKKYLDLLNLLKTSFQLVIVGTITLAAAVWATRVEIMRLLYRQATDFSGDILGVLMWGFVAMSGSYIVGSLLTAVGYLTRANRIFVLAIIINFVMNFILIHNQKALGAAWVTMFTEIFVFVGQLWLIFGLLKPHFQTLTEGGEIKRLLLFLALMFGISILFSQGGEASLRFVFVLLSGFLLAFLLGIVRVKTLLSLLQNLKK